MSRSFVLASLVLSFVACTPARSRDDAHASTSRPTRVSEPVVEPVPYVEILTGGARAEETLPLLVAVHGLGDWPESFAKVFETLPVKARVILPRGIERWEDGYAWFPYRARDGDIVRLAQGVAAASDRVAVTIANVARTRPTLGKPILTGYSQGGMITFGVATRHPSLLAFAVPVSGFLPEPLHPKTRAAFPRIFAIHGATDTIVPTDLDRRGVDALRAVGADVTLVTYPDTGHVVSHAMHASMFDAIVAHVAN